MKTVEELLNKCPVISMDCVVLFTGLIRSLKGCCSADGYGFAPSWIKNEGQGTRDRAHKAMSDYVEVYDYKPESFAVIKYAFTGKNFL